MSLAGTVIGVTADRRADEQAVMLRRLGAEVVFGPTVRTLHGAESDELRARTEALIAEPPDFVVANTGLGVRSWLGLAEKWGLEEQLRQVLSSTRIAARGPKAAGALRIAGLPVWWRAPGETLREVADHLVETGVSGATVAFQEHGDDRQVLTDILTSAGAKVTELPVYRWTFPEDTTPAVRLIQRCCDGTIDAVTFTAGPAVRNLFDLADGAERAGDLLGAFNGKVVAACIGPVCAAVAREVGITDPLVPDRWRLGSLVSALDASLPGRS